MNSSLERYKKENEKLKSENERLKENVAKLTQTLEVKNIILKKKIR